jgi:hypothetical protein
MSPEEAFGIFLILIGCAAPILIVGVVYYLKKRLEHKQIMTAIEKGTPLSELRPPKQNGALWIRNITLGVALIAFALVVVLLGRPGPVEVLLAIAFGVGIAWVVRGCLNRKYQAQSPASAKNDTVASTAPAAVPAAEVLAQADEESGQTD